MNILLVYPEYPDTFWSFKHVLKFVSRKAAFPPLGLLTVAAMLPEEWEKKLVDLNVCELSDEQITWSDMIFISAMLVQKDSAQEIIDRCRALEKKVVAGGPAFTTQYEIFRNVDHFVLNEAEVTLPLFLSDLEKGIPGHVYTSNDRPALTETVTPLWSLIDMNQYISMPVQYSRGCPFNCEFCDIIIMNGQVPRTKTPEQTVDEFQALYDAGWRGSVFVVDDNFIGNTKNAKKMLAHLIGWQKKHGYPYTLFTEASINLADDAELMHLMSAANFDRVFVGIETPSAISLKECSKMQNVSRDLQESVNMIQKNGMQVMAGFIVGFDSDTAGIFNAQIRFIQQAGIATAMVGMLVALPQTRLWHRLKAEGRLLNTESGENTDGSLNFVPRMNRDELLAGYRKIIREIYSPELYYKRISKLIENYKHTARFRFHKERLSAFFMSMWKIGLVSGSRFLYWKLLLKTVFTNIKALPVAVELTIYCRHFEQVAKYVLENGQET